MGLISHTSWSALLDAALDNWVLTGGAVALGLLALEVVQTLYSWNRLRHIRGPALAGFSKLWLIRAVTGGNTNWEFAGVNEKYALGMQLRRDSVVPVEKHSSYLSKGKGRIETDSGRTFAGPLVRVGPNELLTSDPTLLRRMLGVRSEYKRSDWYIAMRFDPSRDSVLSQQDNQLHHILRTKMSPGYSGKEVDALEHKVDRNINALVSLINDKYISTPGSAKPFDFGRKAQFFTLDVISDIAYSEPFGCLPTDSDILGYIQAVEENMPMIMFVSTMPSLNWILKSPIVRKFMPSDRDQLGFGRVMGICKKMAAERFGPDKKERQDMLGSFVRHGLTQLEAESETLLQILAGSETTATAIRATLLHIITTPSVYTKLIAEITSVSPSLPSPIPDSAAKSLPYLQAVIKEGLRFWPPLTGVMSKVTPPAGDDFNGIHIPGGTVVGYSAFGLSRNKQVWGDDASVFRPERWLEGTKEELRSKEAALDLVFGHGRWQCLGKNIAHMELNKIFFELLRNFDIQVANPTKVWESTCAGIFIQHNFWLIATKRE